MWTSSEMLFAVLACLISAARAVKITTDSEIGAQNFVLPGGNIILKCTGGSGLVWKYEDGPIPPTATIRAVQTQEQSSPSELLLSPVGSHGGAYTCTDNGGNKDTFQLNVISEASLDANPVVGNGTSDTTLRCKQRFNPAFPLIWTFPNGTDIVPENYTKGDNRVHIDAADKGSALHLRGATRRDVLLGHYKCRLNTTGSTLPADMIAQLQRIQKTVHYDAKPDVRFDGTAKSKSATKGEPFTLKCIVEGHGSDRVRFWKTNEETGVNTTLLDGPISSLTLCEGSTNEYCIPSTNYKVSRQDIVANDTGADVVHGVTISMHITGTKDEDRGNYTCVAGNEAGYHSASTTLRVKDKLAALWPFLGIVGEVVLLCLIIFCYEKRRNKAADDEDENEPMKTEVHETREAVQRRGK